MIEQIQQPWPWYVAGIIIGLIVPALLILGNKTFGISSNLRHVCAACFPANIPFFNTILYCTFIKYTSLNFNMLN